MREKDFIARIRGFVLRFPSKGLVKGIGDDCAVINPDEGKELLVTADTLAENTHFSRKYFLPREIGVRAMAANISDICAMGGIPKYAFACAGFPKKEKQGFVEKIFGGMISYAASFGVSLAGGDTIRSRELFISITLIGTAKKGGSIKRDGARPGDSLYVTGNLGASGAGLLILQKKGRKNLSGDEAFCAKKHIAPVPRLAEAKVIAGSGAATSCIDVSDGLINDVLNISRESGCGFVIEKGLVPVAPEAAAVFGEKAYDFALYGGEDFELLFTVAGGRENDFERRLLCSGMKFYRIGKAVKSKEVMIKDGGKTAKAGRGKIWSHF